MNGLIDFSPVNGDTVKVAHFAQTLTVAQFKTATQASLDLLVSIVGDATDAEIVHIPDDPLANDPYAAEAERNLGWSLAHLIAHVTATSEEYCAIASILGRGVNYPRVPRLRFETPWREITTASHAMQRLEESRRIRMGYLETIPDSPHLDTLRELSDGYREKFGDQNMLTAIAMGLYHENDHYDQFRDVRAQARVALENGTIRTPEMVFAAE
jgi:hypothetical protein